MKILIDENLSRKLLICLNNFPGSSHVVLCGLEKADDFKIWNYAKSNNFIILTRDIDFNTFSALYHCPPKVIHLKTPLKNESTAYYRDKLIQHQPLMQDFSQSKIHCYLIIE